MRRRSRDSHSGLPTAHYAGALQTQALIHSQVIACLIDHQPGPKDLGAILALRQSGQHIAHQVCATGPGKSRAQISVIRYERASYDGQYVISSQVVDGMDASRLALKARSYSALVNFITI